MERPTIRVTVCELRNDSADRQSDWSALVAHVKNAQSDLVLLPEMPFHPWVAGSHRFDPAVWQAAMEAHDRWIDRLNEMAPATVIGSRPVLRDGKRFNEGFVWTEASGYCGVHTKYYLPDEAGFWEALWYQRGDGNFSLTETPCGRIGFLICTEIWFSRHARDYAKAGIDLLVCPRAAPAASVDKWVAGGRTAAVVSGAYCLSSNFSGTVSGVTFGGTGWIIEPEEGDVLGVTSPEKPFLTLEIDLKVAETAKGTYPRYVPD